MDQVTRRGERFYAEVIDAHERHPSTDKSPQAG